MMGVFGSWRDYVKEVELGESCDRNKFVGLKLKNQKLLRLFV